MALAGTAGAVGHPISVLGRVFVDTNCNGVIDSQDVLVNGVTVELQLATGPVVGTAQTGQFGQTGVYSFPNDMEPIAPSTETNYVLTMLLPYGYVATNAIPGTYGTKLSNTSLTFNLPATATGTSASYDFLICQHGAFVTYTQGGWGAAFHGNNPGAFLAANFANVYGIGGVAIGGGYTLGFTSAKAIENFLPQGGAPRALSASAMNPASKLTVLAGQVLSVQLAVDFSDAGLTTGLLGELRIQSGPMSGMRVRDALAVANKVLGGDLGALPAGMSVSTLNDVMTSINENFDSGQTNHHYLAF